MAYFAVHCSAANPATGTFGRVQQYSRADVPRRIQWDAHDDASTVPYALPPSLHLFVAIASSASHVAQRDQLRRSWLSRFDSSQMWDYAFFAGRGEDDESGSCGEHGGDNMCGDIMILYLIN